MVKNRKPDTPKKLGAAAIRKQQAQEDRERARERRLEHTTHRRKLQRAAEEAGDTEPVQRLPEAHRR